MAKVRLQPMLCESRDAVIRKNVQEVKTGRKCRVSDVMSAVEVMVKQAEVQGVTKKGHAGLGLGERKRFWSEASRQERCKLQEQGVGKLEKERRLMLVHLQT